ncbi:MAG: response regulator [Planctomycetota bacterium]
MTERRADSTPTIVEREPFVDAGFLPTILLVDDDRLECRVFAASLKSYRNYRLEIANDVARAMAILSERVVDLVITDLFMPEVDGFGLVQSLQREERLRHIPIILLSSDDRTTSKITGFELGICDYVTKPFEMGEVVARIDGALKRSIGRRAAGQRKSYSLTGDFTGLSFCDLVNLLAFGQRTGSLSTITPRAAGHVEFVRGDVFDAAFGNLEGAEAIYALMQEQRGQFEFRPRSGGEDPPRRVVQSCMALLMEGARRLDESCSQSNHTTADASAFTPLAWKPVPRRPRAAAPAEQRAAALRDELATTPSKGELHFLSQEELSRWTTMAERDGRFHVVMLAPLLDGVLSLASMAQPISERQLAAAFTEHEATVALHLALPGGTDADIVLLDPSAPARALRSLQLSPHVLLVAPADGDWLSLGVDARLEVASVVAALSPQAIVGIGNDTLADELRSMCQHIGIEIPIHVRDGPLSASQPELRPHWVECVSAWIAATTASSAPNA